jgi:hypothetical protein
MGGKPKKSEEDKIIESFNLVLGEIQGLLCQVVQCQQIQTRLLSEILCRMIPYDEGADS